MKKVVKTEPYGEVEIVEEVKINRALCKSSEKDVWYMVNLDVEPPIARICSKDEGELDLSKLKALR